MDKEEVRLIDEWPAIVTLDEEGNYEITDYLPLILWINNTQCAVVEYEPDGSRTIVRTLPGPNDTWLTQCPVNGSTQSPKMCGVATCPFEAKCMPRANRRRTRLL